MPVHPLNFGFANTKEFDFMKFLERQIQEPLQMLLSWILFLSESWKKISEKRNKFTFAPPTSIDM